MPNNHQLAAMMFADIAGYTAWMQHDESKALILLTRFKEVLEKTSQEHNGKIIQYFGDGCLLSFDSAVNSVDCALLMQDEFKKEPGIPVRIGIHIGEVLFLQENAFGDGVNIASRIETLGIPGAVLLSKNIRDQIRNKAEYKMVSLGHFDFKNVEEKMEVFALANEGLTIPRRDELQGKLKSPPERNKLRVAKKPLLIFSAVLVLGLCVLLLGPFNNRSSPGKSFPPSIAVLNFTNLSGDSTQDYFSDGITEEVRSQLSLINGLRVVSRTSVLPYKNQPKKIQEIAGELGVDHILEGSVRKQGNKVRITAQLINTRTDKQLWSISYNRELKDIFAVQTDIATQIADKLQISLPVVTQKRLQAIPTVNMEAYDRYLKANSLRFMENGLGGQRLNTRKAIGLLQEAVALDPNFSEAFSLLSECYSVISRVNEDPEKTLDSALFFADKSIAINPDKASGYLAKALAHEQWGNTGESLTWLLKANELLPNRSAGKIAFLYIEKNNYAKAYEWVMKAKEYDLNSLENYIEPEGYIYLNLGLLDSMKNCFTAALKIKPRSPEINSVAILYYLLTGNEEEYLKTAKKRMAGDEKMLAYEIGRFYLFQRNWKLADSFYTLSARPAEMDAGLIKIRLGKDELGKKHLTTAINNRLSFIGLNDAWHNYDIARCYAAMKDERYKTYLENAFEKGWHIYAWFEKDPFFDFVRMTPAFEAIDRKITEKNEQFRAELKESMIRYKKEKKD